MCPIVVYISCQCYLFEWLEDVADGKAVVVDNKTYMIKPLHQLKCSDLLWKELVNKLGTKRTLIFQKTVEAPEFVIPAEVNVECVQSSFHVATEYL